MLAIQIIFLFYTFLFTNTYSAVYFYLIEPESCPSIQTIYRYRALPNPDVTDDNNSLHVENQIVAPPYDSEQNRENVSEWEHMEVFNSIPQFHRKYTSSYELVPHPNKNEKTCILIRSNSKIYDSNTARYCMGSRIGSIFLYTYGPDFILKRALFAIHTLEEEISESNQSIIDIAKARSKYWPKEINIYDQSTSIIYVLSCNQPQLNSALINAWEQVQNRENAPKFILIAQDLLSIPRQLLSKSFIHIDRPITIPETMRILEDRFIPFLEKKHHVTINIDSYALLFLEHIIPIMNALSIDANNNTMLIQMIDNIVIQKKQTEQARDITITSHDILTTCKSTIPNQHAHWMDNLNRLYTNIYQEDSFKHNPDIPNHKQINILLTLGKNNSVQGIHNRLYLILHDTIPANASIIRHADINIIINKNWHQDIIKSIVHAIDAASQLYKTEHPNQKFPLYNKNISIHLGGPIIYDWNIIKGNSLGIAIFLLISSCIFPIDTKNITTTGAINSNGLIEPIGNIISKFIGSMHIPNQIYIFPTKNKYDITHNLPEYMYMNKRILFANTTEEIISFLTNTITKKSL